MRSYRSFSSLTLIFLFAAFFAGCAGQTQLESDLGIKGAPDWVNKGTAYVNNKDGRLFHGVGSAAPMGDVSLQRSAADDRARAELARIFSTFIDAASHDYSASAKAADGQVNEEAVSREIKTLTKLDLAGAQIVARWHDKKTNTVWAIAELDMKRLKDTLAAARDMNADARRYLGANADNLFDKLAKEKNNAR